MSRTERWSKQRDACADLMTMGTRPAVPIAVGTTNRVASPPYYPLGARSQAAAFSTIVSMLFLRPSTPVDDLRHGTSALLSRASAQGRGDAAGWLTG